MSTVAAVASIVAAVTSIAALSLAASERKRRRLTEIIDQVTDITAAIAWGSGAAPRRDEMQGRLRTRIGRLALPKTRQLAETQLRAEAPFSDLAADALVEAQTALNSVRLIPRLRSRS